MSIASTRVHLYFRCEKLADRDVTSKSDPYAILFSSPDGVSAHREIGRTETIRDTLDPHFQRSILVDYFFEQKQFFILKIYDDDGKGPAGDDSLGIATFQLAHVVGSRGATTKLDLKPGTIFVSAKEVSRAGRDSAKFFFFGKGLKKMDLFGKSDPYFKIQFLMPNQTTKLIFQSPVIDNTLDPEWPGTPPIKIADITTSELTDVTIRFECFDKDVISDDDMGWFDCSFQQLIDNGKDNKPFTLKDAKGESYGLIFCRNVDICHVPTFLELLSRGLQINLVVSIDFTGSNGDPRNPKSLHYMDPQQPNQYSRAIMSVGDILLEYDSDKMVPLFGFGAQMPDGQVSHFFHVNFQQSPYVQHVPGIMAAYAAALPAVRLAGPTNFAPTIAAVTNIAKQAAGNYTVLLILTDGDITDMDRTLDAIVKADGAPMSIIIVGIGRGCDFEMMTALDGDGAKLSSNGVVMRRDMVQFVPFKEFEFGPPGALAAEVLKEVPEQVVDWAVATGYKPPH